MATPELTRAQQRARHRARRSRHRARTIALLATLSLVAVMVSGLAWWGLQARGAVSCGDSPVQLRVATSPSLVDVLTKQAAGYALTQPTVGRACVTVDVKAMTLTQVEGALVSAAERKGDAGFDVWVPESSTWATALSRRPEVDRMLPNAFTILATSPVVAAMPEPMAKAIGWPAKRADLAQLVTLAQQPEGWARFGHPEWGRVRVGWQAPQTSAIGLDALMTMSASFAQGAADPDALRSGLLRVQNAVSKLDVEEADALAPLRDPSLSADEALTQSMIIPSTERDVSRFNSTEPRIKLAPVPVGTSGTSSKVGYISLFDTVLDRQRAIAAAEQFREYLVSAKGATPFVDDGWQLPRAKPDTAPVGLVSGEYAAPSVDAVTRSLQSWSALKRRGSVLLVVDVSGSMKAKVPSSDLTRLQLAQQALTSAVISFSDRSSLGLWEFSRRLDGAADHRVVVPLGPSSDTVGRVTRRQAVRAGIARLRARGDTGLYDTTLAAVREMQRKWTPDTDVVVILSDGKNDDPGSIDLKGLTATLVKERDSAHPVRVYTIAYGAEADAAALRAISTATKGASFAAQSPADIERVLLASLTD
jgi:Ca-activated chloride channel family protein